MTETAPPQTLPDESAAGETPFAASRQTPLARLLTAASAPELAAYRGLLTPHELDAPEREAAALAFGAAVHDLGWLRRVAVRGEDRFRWLSGMVTNTVNDLGANAGAWNLVLNAQGRIQGDLYVWRDGEDLELVIAADQYEKLRAHLNRFIIMDDVELVPLTLDANQEVTGATALGVAGPMAAALLTRLGLPAPQEPLTGLCSEWNGCKIKDVRAYGLLAPHYELWIQSTEIAALWQALTAAGATPVGVAALEAFRIAEAIPAYAIDIAERDLPQETAQMRALCFDKGCYLGQEIVERIRSRGSVHRHLRALEISGPPPAAGTELFSEAGEAAGQITSAAGLALPQGRRIFALGMIRDAAGIHSHGLTYTAGATTGSARILDAPLVLKAS